MKPADLVALLGQFLGERAAARDRLVAAAAATGQYDLNNTCQYVIAREDQHLSWLRDAIARLGGGAGLQPAAAPVPDAAASDERAILAEEARQLDAFIARWRERVASVSDARNRRMLDVILGEAAEHARLFRQGASGCLDLLGRRTGGERTEGRVLPTRWVE